MQFSVSEARRFRNLSQKSVAKSLGISRSAYISLEKNPEKMTIERAKRFAEIVNIPIEDIIFLHKSSTFSR